MFQLKAKIREKSAKAKKIRRDELIPAIVYGQEKKAESITADYIEFEKLYEQVGESSLIDLAIGGGEEKKVLIHDIQTDPVTGKYLHVDFYEVDLSKKVKTNVELDFVGEASIVKNEGGILIKHLNEIEIECLPNDLIKKFKVDVSGLTSFDSSIHVKDLKISDKVEILNDPEEVIINVSEPKEEEISEPQPIEGEEAKEAEEKKEEGGVKKGEGEKEGQGKVGSGEDKKGEEAQSSKS